MAERPDDLVELTTVVNELEAGVIESVLAEAGIPASHRTAKGAFLGSFGLSSVVPTTVVVRREDMERANQALAANRSDSVDIDWDEVDVGEPEDGIARRLASRSEPSQRSGKRASGVFLVGVAIVALLGLFAAGVCYLIVAWS